MKLKELFKNLISGIRDGISRFLPAFICTVFLYLICVFEIIFETNSDELIVPLAMSFILTAVFSIALKTSFEYLCSKLTGLIQYISCAVACVITFILTYTFYDSLYTIMAYSGVIVSLICFIFFVLMRGENRDRAFPAMVTSLAFSGAICAVLSAGLSVCIAAFQELIFSWDDFYKIYSIVNLFVWTVGFINIFLSFIPKKDTAAPQSKIFRALVLFAGLPLYALLILILLIYLGKIVITWNMPVGEINWFASFASLFFIFFLLSVMQYSQKPAKLFAKFGGYFLIPVLIMQAIAVFERISAYGLTTPRTVSLVLIIISILFIAGSVIIPKHLNKIALAAGVIALIVTVTPLNIIDMPVASQTKILKSVLISNNMLKDNEVIHNANISNEDARKIISSYEYLKYNAKKVPEFIPDSKKSTKEIFGFENSDVYTRDEENYTYCTFRTNESADITEYSKMIRYNTYDNTLKIDRNGNQYELELKPIAMSLYEKYGSEKSDTDMELYIVDENTALSFSSFSFSIVNEEAEDCHFNGYVLFRN